VSNIGGGGRGGKRGRGLCCGRRGALEPGVLAVKRCWEGREGHRGGRRGRGGRVGGGLGVGGVVGGGWGCGEGGGRSGGGGGGGGEEGRACLLSRAAVFGRSVSSLKKRARNRDGGDRGSGSSHLPVLVHGRDRLQQDGVLHLVVPAGRVRRPRLGAESVDKDGRHVGLAARREHGRHLARVEDLCLCVCFDLFLCFFLVLGG